MDPYYTLIDHPFQFASYLVLITTIITLWVYKKVWVWAPLAACSLGLALYSDLAPLVVLIPIGFLTLSLSLLSLNTPPIIRLFIVVIAATAAFALFSHLIKGTNNLLLFQGTVKPGSIPYTMYWNFDKGFAGMLLLAIAHPLISDPMHFKLALRRSILWAGLSIICLLGTAYAFDMIRFDLSVSGMLPLWILSNLFFVAIAEEALFRGLLQRELSDALPQRFGPLLSVLIVALAFALVHLVVIFDMRYALLAFGAGLFYGLTYSTTKSIEASIFVHFLVNATHIIFFSYPFLS